jgi:hypothetical protein
MDAPLTLGSATAIALGIVLVFGSLSFLWPENAFRRSIWAAAVAVAGPAVIAVLADPFLGSGAGLGVALILYVLAAMILLGAFAAAAGAASRYLWDAWRTP